MQEREADESRALCPQQAAMPCQVPCRQQLLRQPVGGAENSQSTGVAGALKVPRGEGEGEVS